MKIVTSVVNNVDFLDLQFRTLIKHMKVSFEFIVFNDAKDWIDYSNFGDSSIKKKIEFFCKNNNITCINIPNGANSRSNNHHKIRDASVRTAQSMNYILEFQKLNPDKYLILDSDMFLISDFTQDDFLKYDSAIVLQERNDCRYIWNGLCYFNTPKLDLKTMNWWGVQNNTQLTDTGGCMKDWLSKKIEANDENGIFYIQYLSSLKWNQNDTEITIPGLLDWLKSDTRNVDGNFFCELYCNKFLHFRGGGNWIKNNIHNKPDQKFILQLKNILLG